jgi:hypothetical protein
MARKRKTPHQKIMRAASKDQGLRLSADEVFQLSMDGAIATCAENDDEAERLQPPKRKEKKG